MQATTDQLDFYAEPYCTPIYPQCFAIQESLMMRCFTNLKQKELRSKPIDNHNTTLLCITSEVYEKNCLDYVHERLHANVIQNKLNNTTFIFP